jgi:hypothetical protein
VCPEVMSHKAILPYERLLGPVERTEGKS